MAFSIHLSMACFKYDVNPFLTPLGIHLKKTKTMEHGSVKTYNLQTFTFPDC